MKLLAFLVTLLASASAADTLVPAHTIRAQTVIEASDLLVRDTNVAGALADPADVIGKEARVSLYAGRPIRASDIGPPALITRNQLVTLRYKRGNLLIKTEARALGRAAAGERIQVMNLTSKSTLVATVLPDGSLQVAQ
ncbi:flagellar basal body P-ring formation protein FlgA [Lentibacter algarum]|uniref:flagellar basal body P-ring formation chaperone FlgA n=1 Tax=Lentibacter algarum TaxID=576131 RepID=UPI001C078DC4|nr:flagellar basal body P-ring formation chaperone FlgA [Lentibacter algarum]MBU2981200.1 flagellar basal body P-ring formation protein FlgA [Lentibacter algarum]